MWARLKQRSPLGQPARVLPLAPRRFRRRAALTLAREGRSRSSLLWLLLLGLLGLAVAPLFAFGHGLPPLRLRSRITWIFIELKREAVLRRATQRRQCSPAQPAQAKTVGASFGKSSCSPCHTDEGPMDRSWGLPWGWLGLLETTTSKVRVPSRVSRNSLKLNYGTKISPVSKVLQVLAARPCVRTAQA